MSAGPPSPTAKGQAAPSRRGWPEASQFNEAVQNLATSLVDRELQAGQPELGPLGMPMPYAGNFADVYKVHCPATGSTWAVKFFKREFRDLRERYRAISEHWPPRSSPSWSIFTTGKRCAHWSGKVSAGEDALGRGIDAQSLRRPVADLA